MKHTLIRTVDDAEASAAFSGCGIGRAAAARRVADAPPVVVNGVEIPEAAIAQEAQHHPASSAEEARAAAARALAIRELLLQQARRLGLAAEPLRDDEGREEAAEEALIRAILESQVEPTEPTDEECGRVYAVRFGESGVSPSAALPRIRQVLRARAWRAAAARYVAELVREAHIEGLSLVLGRVANGL
jgi:peptidyl-prolyl cis-trans isomerase C